jgi:hypothetical protein
MDPFFIIPGIAGTTFPKLLQKIDSTLEQIYPFNKEGMHFKSFDCYPDLEMNAPSILHQCSMRIMNTYSVLIGRPKITYSTFDLGLFEINQKQWFKLSAKQLSHLEHKWSPEVTFSGVLMLKNSNGGIIKKFESIEDFLIGGSPNSALLCPGDLIQSFEAKMIHDSEVCGNLFFYFQGLYVP